MTEGVHRGFRADTVMCPQTGRLTHRPFVAASPDEHPMALELGMTPVNPDHVLIGKLPRAFHVEVVSGAPEWRVTMGGATFLSMPVEDLPASWRDDSRQRGEALFCLVNDDWQAAATVPVV